MKIGIFDSGIGGTTILTAVKKLLKDEEYFYLADSKNCPYGEKSDQELQNIVTKNTETLLNWGAEIIIIACNTATVKCIDYLREKYRGVPFIGTEPAIKLAAETDARSILVLATPGTVSSEHTHLLMSKNQKPGQAITLLSCPGLADTIEHNLKLDENYHPCPLTAAQSQAIDKKLSELLEVVRIAPDVVVLGCTHYSLIKPKIQNYFPTARLIDSSSGVARHVEALVKNS